MTDRRDPADHPTGPAGGTLFARRWDDDKPDARPEHPQPIVRGRTITCDDIGPWAIPTTLRRVVRARAPGWQFTITIALGYRMLARTPWVAAEPSLSHVLRARGATADGHVAAYGLWVDGKFSEAAWWVVNAAGVPDHVPRPLESRSFTAVLRAEPREDVWRIKE